MFLSLHTSGRVGPHSSRHSALPLHIGTRLMLQIRRETQLAKVSEWAPGTFPKGLLGVLRTRALVRGVNLLANSAGSSCQSLLDSSCPLGAGLYKRRCKTQQYLLS